jgi:uncharacterized protein YdaU (DUF1376 family)
VNDFDAKSARTRQPMPLWSGAFDRATKEQGPEIIGAYMLILMAMWEAKSCDLPADEKHLAWVAKVSPTIWRRKYAPVIMPMLSVKNSRIFSEKLQENAEKTEEYCRKQHQRKSGKSEPKSLKTKEPTATADVSADQSTVKPPDQPLPLTINHIEEGGGGCSAYAREAADPQQEVPSFRERILAAMGVAPDGILGPSKFVGGQGDMAEAARWLALPGITEDIAVREIAAQVATKRDGPPSRFSYFTPGMQRLSGQLTAPPLAPAGGAGPRASPPAQPPRQPVTFDLSKFDDYGNRIA